MSMFNPFTWRKAAPPAPAKSGTTVALTSLNPTWTGKGFGAFSAQGYRDNNVVYRAVNIIARTCASVPLLVRLADAELPAGHPLAVSLRRPSPSTSLTALRFAIHADWSLAGDAYALRIAAPVSGRFEIMRIRPDRIEVTPGADGIVASYTIKGASGGQRIVKIDPNTGACDLLRLTSYNPDQDNIGASPLEAGAKLLDTHNQATAYNKGVLENEGRPAGIITTEGDLTSEQSDQLRDSWGSFQLGKGRFKKPLILTGGLNYQEIGQTMAELQFLEGRRELARELCGCFGVPPLLLGIPGDSTYSNLQEARAAFWDDTVIPRVLAEADALTAWLEPFFPGVSITADFDSVPALRERMASKVASLAGADYLTPNEKRAEIGYDTLPGGDVPLVNAGLVPLSLAADDSAPPPEMTPADAAAAKAEAYG